MNKPRIYTPSNVAREADPASAETQLQPGPFPVDALNETQKRIVESVATVHELPIELAAMPALAVTGAALGKSWKLTSAVNGRENFANLYVIAGAEKSVGKGGAAAQIAEPIVRASDKLIDDWKARERPALESRQYTLEARTKYLINCLARRKDGKRSLSQKELQGMDAELRDARAEIGRNAPLLAVSPSYHVGNATSEALAIKFARNDDTLFCYSPEGGDTLRVILGKYSKDEKADCDLWLSGYSVEPYQADRVGRGNVNITPCLTALIFCQPSLLRELYGNEEAFERGLTARVLPFICESPLREDDGEQRSIPTLNRDAWLDLIAGLLNQRTTLLAAGNSITVECEPAAREIFRAFHNESIRLRNGQFRDIQGELGRWRENACRIALGLCIADDPTASVLTAKQAERAVKLARWAHYSALQVMQAGRMERRLVRVNRLDACDSSGSQANDGSLSLFLRRDAK